jgi:predicted nucleotidyltransferase
MRGMFCKIPCTQLQKHLGLTSYCHGNCLWLFVNLCTHTFSVAHPFWQILMHNEKKNKSKIYFYLIKREYKKLYLNVLKSYWARSDVRISYSFQGVN